MTWLRIWWLKRRARRLHAKTILPAHLDCGRHMARFIHPGIAIAEEKYQATIDELRRIDPNFPKEDTP